MPTMRDMIQYHITFKEEIGLGFLLWTGPFLFKTINDYQIVERLCLRFWVAMRNSSKKKKLCVCIQASMCCSPLVDVKGQPQVLVLVFHLG